ncbi:Flp pilus assembly complex ATPase component TadA [Clostridium sp. 19966]|uniref:GspE/PulE family protein n=1 Tax=Clostridium sp. 19966 TaxID=2768166 RepID=UPI0028DE17E0|nr:ATPase, T2SS/T4P/T4SS family [Clostridium sp. 19966]MDT8715486.1 Flp pilus assembly complex ATPase component TadA [Clostridium sp. 19966]
MERIVKRRLGDLLVQSGKINMKQLQDALSRQKTLGKKLGELLIDDGLVTEEDIISTIETQTGIKRVDLNSTSIDKMAIKSLPQSICTKHDLIPFGFNENTIQIAMWDPLNIFAIDDVSISTGFEVETFIAKKEDIRKNIERQYSNEQVLKAAAELSKESQEDNKSQAQEEVTFDDIKNAPVVKMVDYLIKNAIEARASDIHIEPFEKSVRIRYRIDGQLQQISSLSVDSLAALVTRIKILANLNIAEKRAPQDGRILMRQENADVDLRVSILPTVFGEKIVIRILSRDNYKIGIENLGMNEYELKQLNNIIKSPHGIMLVTGPTGSGKSTTLYTILNQLNNLDKNIITVEDPVEYTLEGVNQVNVNVKAGLTFASGLRSILRQDPDIVMIGEIRDGETAEIAIRAAITGHLVLSTLHTNDAPSSVMRLIDMGVQSYLVATSLSGVIAQRLVKKICPRCKEEYEASDYEKAILGITKNEAKTLYRGKGCAYCNNTGYSGRTGVYEIMEITREHRDAIVNSNSSELLKDLSIKNGMKTLGQACKELVNNGITTVEELVKIAYMQE